MTEFCLLRALLKDDNQSIFGQEAGADLGFFLGGGALFSCSTSTPINHIIFFFAEYQLY